MATPKLPYDPARSITGLWKGAIARLGYVLKDPTSYGPSNPLVLAEVAKKFQDSLDDCETQILDAKWYLEHQLAQNKARREAKLREEGAAVVKRKHGEIQDVTDAEGKDEGEQVAKRMKIEDTSADISSINETQQQAEPEKTQPPPEAPIPPSSSAAQATTSQPIATVPEKQQTPIQPEKPIPPPSAPEKRPEPQANISIDDFTKPTPQDSPSYTNNDEDFNFESMFGEPTVETTEDTNNNDLGFDLNLEPSDPLQQETIPSQSIQPTTQVTAADHSSPNALLPGLESYANQAGDGDIFNVENKATADAQAAANDFQLPDLTENDFDAFFNENSFDFNAPENQVGRTGGAHSGADFTGDINLGDLDLENMDFTNEDIFK